MTLASERKVTQGKGGATEATLKLKPLPLGQQLEQDVEEVEEGEELMKMVEFGDSGRTSHNQLRLAQVSFCDDNNHDEI